MAVVPDTNRGLAGIQRFRTLLLPEIAVLECVEPETLAARTPVDLNTIELDGLHAALTLGAVHPDSAGGWSSTGSAERAARHHIRCRGGYTGSMVRTGRI